MTLDWDWEREYVVEVDISESVAITVHPDEVPEDAEHAIEEYVEQKFWESEQPFIDLTVKFAEDGVAPSQVSVRDVYEDPYTVRKRTEEAFVEFLCKEKGGRMEWGGDFREFCRGRNVSVRHDVPEILWSLWRDGTIDLVDGGVVEYTGDDDD